MTEPTDETKQTTQINTSGGAYIEGNVQAQEVVGRDKFSIGTYINNFFQGTPEEVRRLRNRQAMLKIVKSIWIEGWLERSLYKEMLIELGIAYDAGMVENPWNAVVQQVGQVKTIEHGTKIIDIFDHLNQSMLILGESGFGKTTMLLELARSAIVEAEKDVTKPIPVVFNLSSWAEKRLPLNEWLMDEFRVRYIIPKSIAQQWLDNNELLILLDGLDEVKNRYRKQCVQSINIFREQYLIPIAVCCRLPDYKPLTLRLKLSGSIVIQPLTPQQVNKFFVDVGLALSISEVIQKEYKLFDWATSPLMLNIVALVHDDLLDENLSSLKSAPKIQKYIFNTYIRSMFRRRNSTSLLSQEKTIYLLRMLAQKLIEHQQTVFLIEYIQPTWLSSKKLSLYRKITWACITIFGGLSVGIIHGVVSAIILGKPFSYISFITGTIVGLILTSTFGLKIAHINIISIQPVDKLSWFWKKAFRAFFSIRIWIICIGYGILYGLLFAMIENYVTVSFLWFTAPDLLAYFRITPLTNFIILFPYYFLAALYYGFLLLPIIVLSLGFTSGLNINRIEIKQFSNQGIKYSIMNYLLSISIIGVIGLLFSYLYFLINPGNGLFVNEVETSKSNYLAAYISIGLSSAPILSLRYGGFALLQHLTLRIMLWIYNIAPLHYTKFLDYCVDRIFLRKVGGGYIFIHRMIMEHFASLTDEDIKRIAASVEAKK